MFFLLVLAKLSEKVKGEVKKAMILIMMLVEKTDVSYETGL